MYTIHKITLNPTVDFAADELKKYLRMMMPRCGEISIAYAPEATEGFRLGLMQDFGLDVSEAEDVFLDDWWVSDGSSEIQLENSSLLNAELLAWAAEYSADGRMTDVVIGALKEINGVWSIDLPCETRSNWTIYLLNPVTYAPVCEVLTGF